MKSLSINLQYFKQIIENNSIYVDKTHLIHQLLSEKKTGFYFLSRPRRFGKSILITTLFELFKGSKELFKNSFIYDKWEFEEYPVIHISFLGVEYKDKSLTEGLIDKLKQISKKYDILLETQYPKELFIELISKLKEKYNKDVVVLIDEYDKPVIDYLNNSKAAKTNQDILKNFYIVLKEMSDNLKFVFITGISKFSNVSIFGDMNHFTDLTIDDKYSTICGYTKDEIINNYDDRLEIFAQKEQITKDELIERINNHYNGYTWDLKNYVYNPFSLLNTFQKNTFDNYWFESGTPTFLLDLIKTELKQEVSLFDFQTLDNLSINRDLLGNFDVENFGLVDILFQTGYLTLKGYNKEFNEYILGFPNYEVKSAFSENLLQYLTKTQTGITSYLLKNIIISLKKKAINLFVQSFKSLFASIPYNMFSEKEERYYQTIIYTVLQIIGLNIDCEIEIIAAKTDAVIDVNNHIYVIEFKVNPKDRKAIKQIINKKYYEKYMLENKTITLLGIYFCKDKRNIVDIEEIDLFEIKN